MVSPKVEWNNTLKKPSVFLKEHALLIAICFFSIILRILWIKLPVHTDEGEAGYDAMLWLGGHLPYAFRSMDKPPLMYLLYLISISVFGNDIISVRMLNNVLSLASIVALYLFVKDWYGKKIGLVSALFYGTFMSVPAIEGPYALASSLSLSFFIFSVYSCNKYLRVCKKWLLFISGILMSMASLIYQQWAVGCLLLLIIVILKRRNSTRQNTQNKRVLVIDSIAEISTLIGGIVVPISAFAIYFWSNGALYDLIQSTVVEFIGYASSGSFLRSQAIPFGWTLLTFIEGLPLWLLSICGLPMCIRRLSESDKYLLSWSLLSVGLFLVEPNHFGHHTQLMVPAASILCAIALAHLPTVTYSIPRRKLSPSTTTWTAWRQKVESILIILIILTSFVPSIFFQAQQYPNFSIDWEYHFKNVTSLQIQWVPLAGGNYDTQMELVSYLKSLGLRDGEVLMDGWMTPVYWLSGLEAPSKYLCTIPEWAPIPMEEYERLVNNIEEKNFKYVILTTIPISFASVYALNDPIAENTITNYFYVRSIGDNLVYSKYPPGGEDVYYRFIEEFPQALKEYDLPNGTKGDLETAGDPVVVPTVRNMVINDEMKVAIYQHPVQPKDTKIMNSYIIYNNVSIPPNSTLTFSTGIDPNAWNKEGDGVQFKILIEDEGKFNEIFSEYIDPKHFVDDRIWHDHQLDLTEYSNRTVNVYFVTNPGPNGDVRYDWAYFGDPVILIKPA